MLLAILAAESDFGGPIERLWFREGIVYYTVLYNTSRRRT